MNFKQGRIKTFHGPGAENYKWSYNQLNITNN